MRDYGIVWYAWNQLTTQDASHSFDIFSRMKGLYQTKSYVNMLNLLNYLLMLLHCPGLWHIEECSIFFWGHMTVHIKHGQWEKTNAKGLGGMCSQNPWICLWRGDKEQCQLVNNTSRGQCNYKSWFFLSMQLLPRYKTHSLYSNWKPWILELTYSPISVIIHVSCPRNVFLLQSITKKWREILKQLSQI